MNSLLSSTQDALGNAAKSTLEQESSQISGVNQFVSGATNPLNSNNKKTSQTSVAKEEVKPVVSNTQVELTNNKSKEVMSQLRTFVLENAKSLRNLAKYIQTNETNSNIMEEIQKIMSETVSGGRKRRTVKRKKSTKKKSKKTGRK